MRTAVVILAAGRGERMNSSVPKVLHKLFDKSMLQHVVDSALGLKPEIIILVVSRNMKEIKGSLNPSDKIRFAVQKEPKGTADAVSKALPFLSGFHGTILVLNGDTPLITPETLSSFLRKHRKERNDISFISFIADDPKAYGRVVRDTSGRLKAIIEEKDATELQKKIHEVNSGIYAIESRMLEQLKDIKINVLKGEYYLTDIVGISAGRGSSVRAFCIGTEDEMSGVNTVSELARARQFLRKKIIAKWEQKGIIFIDPESAFIHQDVVIGKDTVIYPCVMLEARTKIGKACVIYPNVRIIDSVINDRSVIKDSTVIEGSVIRAGAVIGPFAHLRPGSEIGSGGKIGNFVEVKKSVIGDNTKASHLSYLGDAKIGKNVNIGAGTITCNYDGRKKNRTTIENNVFIGSDTQLVAPVKIGKGAYIGAGSTITKDVPALSLAVTRTEQRHIKNWVSKNKKKVK